METQKAINVIEKYTHEPISSTVKEAHQLAAAALEKQMELKMWIESFSAPEYQNITWTQPELNKVLKEFLIK